MTAAEWSTLLDTAQKALNVQVNRAQVAEKRATDAETRAEAAEARVEDVARELMEERGRARETTKLRLIRDAIDAYLADA